MNGGLFPRAPKILYQGPPRTLEEDEDEGKGTVGHGTTADMTVGHGMDTTVEHDTAWTPWWVMAQT